MGPRPIQIYAQRRPNFKPKFRSNEGLIFKPKAGLKQAKPNKQHVGQDRFFSSLTNGPCVPFSLANLHPQLSLPLTCSINNLLPKHSLPTTVSRPFSHA